LDVFVNQFSRLNMSARFEFESDLTIDPETKERIRCKRMIALCAHCTEHSKTHTCCFSQLLR
jgi:hypothetical protein